MIKLLTLAITLIIIGLILIPWWLNRHTPQPTYQVLKQHGKIELRQYDGMLLATTNVDDDRSAAINTGFKRLAGYIFGRHTSTDESNIAMTAPVIQSKPVKKTSRISMTTPVIQTNPGDQDQTWQVAFIMPKHYSKDTIPKPIDNNIIHMTQKSSEYLTLRFTGLINSKRLDQKAMLLKAYAQKHDIELTGEPIFAFYDPPWILPWLRRHEVWFLVAKE